MPLTRTQTHSRSSCRCDDAVSGALLMWSVDASAEFGIAACRLWTDAPRRSSEMLASPSIARSPPAAASTTTARSIGAPFAGRDSTAGGYGLQPLNYDLSLKC